jgi:tetraacyldisaccharide 4'-kinase
LKNVLQRAWLTRGWLALLLWPLAWIHGLAVSARVQLYRLGVFKSERFPVAVIVVGNVVAGGAGKTPLVIAIAKHLQAQGIRTGVVSRGYGRSGDETLEIDTNTPVNKSGDEPALIKRAVAAPVFVALRRADAVRALITAYPATSVVLCDDGLQHYALQRDIEIAAFDDRGIGNGWLLPAGPLREPWPERLDRGVDFVVHTGQAPAFAGFASRRRLADYALDSHGDRVALDTLKVSPVTAVAAIAEPEAFFSMLRQRGIRLQKTVALPDHHDFSDFDLSLWAGQTVLCTEKDAVKLFSKPQPAETKLKTKLLAVPLEFSPEPAFLAALDARLARVFSQLPSRHGHQTS